MFYLRLMFIFFGSFLFLSTIEGEELTEETEFVYYFGNESFPTRFEGLFQEYKYDKLSLIAKFLPENPVIFEAGGHDGGDTLRFAKKWPKAEIFSFEPNPPSFTKLLNATKGNPNIHPFNLAVNNYTGTAFFYVCDGNSGASSLLEPTSEMEYSYKGPKIVVPCVILDHWCDENNLKSIDFMWLDLEGVELQLLQSSPRILSTVQVIYTETNFRDFRKGTSKFNDLKKHLEESGFQLISHWFLKGWQGDALFIRKNAFLESILPSSSE